MGFWQLSNNSGFTDTAQAFDSDNITYNEYLSTIYSTLYSLELNYRYNISFKYIGEIICHGIPDPYPAEWFYSSTIRNMDIVPSGLTFGYTPGNYTNNASSYSSNFITKVISTGDTTLTSFYDSIYGPYFSYTTQESYSYIYVPKYLAFTSGMGNTVILDDVNLIYLNEVNSPLCSTLNISNVTTSGVTLNGMVDPYGLKTDAFFRLRLMENPFTETTITGTTWTGYTMDGTDNIEMKKVLSLTSGKTYNCYTYASNSMGSYTGNTILFYTANNPIYYINSGYTDNPLSYIMPNNFTYTGITLKATLYNYWLSNNIILEYGTSLSYGNSTGIGTFTGATSYQIERNLTGLTTDLYYYRFRVMNDFGTSYSSVYTFRTIPLGAIFQGGHVYYFADSGHGTGLIMSEDDVTSTTWGCSGVDITTSANFGTGIQNTLNIVSGCATIGIAAEVAYSSSLSGYTDWYLPSRYEIEGTHFFDNTPIHNDAFWTSTQTNSTNAVAITRYTTYTSYAKTTTVRTRIIRSF